MTDAAIMCHRSQRLYLPGERVPIGSWGHTILGIGPAHNFYFREYLFEKIRQAEFNDKPSRMDSVFAFVNQQFALNWQRGQENTYAVHLSDPTGNIHRGDMSWLDQLYQCRTFEAAEYCARRYWKGEQRQPDALEIVAASDLIVEERIFPVDITDGR